MVREVERYYTRKLAMHGATPAGVDWSSEHGQLLRFEQLLAVIAQSDLEPSVNDYGCGYGGLVDSLAARREHFTYCGYDVSEAMIEAARARHAPDSRVTFVSDRRHVRLADFTIASGVFNVRLQQPKDIWQRYVLATIDELVRISRRGIAFNALTTHSDQERMRPDLYYADPAMLLDHCLRHHSRNVVLNHNYELYEFTVIVRLDGRPPATIRAEG
jgi:SAM-dependent methyltransferase